jgi:hypothetical protein
MERQTTAATSGRQGCVLVVDDVAAVRKSISLTLTCAGYEVVTAEDGEQAIQLLQESDGPPTVDAIFCDLRMPKNKRDRGDSLFSAGVPERPCGHPDRVSRRRAGRVFDAARRVGFPREAGVAGRALDGGQAGRRP